MSYETTTPVQERPTNEWDPPSRIYSPYGDRSAPYGTEPPIGPPAQPFEPPAPPIEGPPAQGPRKSRGGGWLVALAIIVSLIAGAGAGALAASWRISQATPSPTGGNVSIPQAGGIALPKDATIADLVKAVDPGIAAIHVQMARGQAAGTGFLIDKDGHIVTNKHVVSDARSVNVDLGGKTKLPAKVVGVDPNLDVAVIKVDGTPAELKPLTLGDANALQVGDRVVAIGNALNLPGGPTVTSGIVSAKNREIADQNESGQAVKFSGLIQTDAAINPGNSGGPLLNLAGQVVGINTLAAGDPNGNGTAQNIGFAQNINDVKLAAENIINGKTGSPGNATAGSGGYIGVTSANVDSRIAERLGLPVDYGVLIVSVESGGPADKAGIETNDVVVAVDGKKIETSTALRTAITSHKPGDTIALDIYRDGAKQQIKVTVGG